MNDEVENWCSHVMKDINDIVFTWFPCDCKDVNIEKLDHLTKPLPIVDVAKAVERNSIRENGEKVPQEWVDCFYDKIAQCRYARSGIWMYGCEVTYDPERKFMLAKDGHEAEVKVIDERNRPVAFVKIYGESGKYRIPADKLDDFFHCKGISSKAVRFDPDSIDKYYAYRGHKGYRCFVRQTPAVRDARRRASSAEFIRYDINKTSDENDFGLTFAVWEDHLVSDGIYLSELTEEDFAIAIDGYTPDSWYAKEVTRIYNAQKNKDVVKNAVEKFSTIRNKIQAVIDSHSVEIFDHMLTCMGIDPEMKSEPEFRDILHTADQSYGFDCGWVHFAFTDESLADIAKTASMDTTCNVYGNGAFSLHLPYNTQSTTVKKYQAEKIIDLVKDECRLYTTTQLD